jgi:hypothetical protein
MQEHGPEVRGRARSRPCRRDYWPRCTEEVSEQSICLSDADSDSATPLSEYTQFI